jgi:hypothetical protein
VTVTVAARDGPEASGGLPERAYEPAQRAIAAFQPVARDLHAATVCIANRGGGTLGVYGEVVVRSAGIAQLPAGVRQPSPRLVVHLDYQQATKRSWWSFAGTVADRFGLVKATFFGAWTFWVAVAAMAALWLAATVYAARAFTR